jgi:hypothetical protein
MAHQLDAAALKQLGVQNALNQGQTGCVGLTGEFTVGELLDRRIEKAERLLKSLHDLKGSLPGTFLSSGASRISPLLEV